MHNGPYLVAMSQNHSNNDLSFALRCLSLNQLWCFGVATSHQYIVSHENSTKFSIQSNSNTTVTGNLDVGPSQAQSSVKTYFNHVGNSGFMMMEGRCRDQGFLHIETNYPYGEMFLTVRNTYFIRCSDYASNPYVQTFQPLTQSPDDRLKGNEELIENACETLSKLRPQLYDKKPDMENDDPTTWYKESGLIAQEIYYDAPELRHSIHKGKPETDEDGNIIPLPEIPTSIDPKSDPDYSSWCEEPASVNYIGLIAYLIKANTELHERVKALRRGLSQRAAQHCASGKKAKILQFNYLCCFFKH